MFGYNFQKRFLNILSFLDKVSILLYQKSSRFKQAMSVILVKATQLTFSLLKIMSLPKRHFL